MFGLPAVEYLNKSRDGGRHTAAAVTHILGDKKTKQKKIKHVLF